MAIQKTRIQINQADLKRLSGKINNLNKLSTDGVREAMRENAIEAVHRMQRDAPYDTGRLRKNIEYAQTTGNGVIIESEAIDPEDHIDYAPIQEFGGRYNRAQPYFYKNIRLFVSKLYKDLSNRIKKIIK